MVKLPIGFGFNAIIFTEFIIFQISPFFPKNTAYFISVTLKTQQNIFNNSV